MTFITARRYITLRRANWFDVADSSDPDRPVVSSLPAPVAAVVAEALSEAYEHGREDAVPRVPVKGPDHERRAALLGKRVRVTLNHGSAATGGAARITEGVLLGFGNEGTAEIEEDDGFVHYCWPALNIEEVTP